MKKRVIASIITASMVCGIGINTVATPLTESQKQEIKANQQKFSEINDKIRQLESEIDKLTDKIDPVFELIEENNKEIENTKNEIVQVEGQINEAQADIDKQQVVLGGRIRATYKNGVQGNYLAMLLESESVGDLLSKVQAINTIMNIDKEIIDELNEKKEVLAEKVSTLEAKNEELNKLNAENQVKIDEFNKMKDEQQVIVDNMNVERKKIISELAPQERELVKPVISTINSNSSVQELKNAINSLKGLLNQIETTEVANEIKAAISKAESIIKDKNTVSTPSVPNRGDEVVSGNASSIISYARQFIGKPYVYGATGPNSFDCSGFTQYVFKKFGYSITRTTKTQVKQGRAVSYSQLQPGDLVFTRGSASAPGHVGIYTGNGKMVHASRPGVGVIEGKIYDFVTARRIL